MSAANRGISPSPSHFFSSRSPPAYHHSSSLSSSPASTLNNSGNASPTTSSSIYYSAAAVPVPTKSRSFDQADYSTPGQRLRGYDGTKTTVDAHAGVQRGTRTSSSFGGISHFTAGSAAENDGRYDAGRKHGKKQTQATPATTTTMATTSTRPARNEVTELQQAANAGTRHPTRDDGAKSASKKLPARTSRSVGTEEIRTSEATTMTTSHEIETRILDDQPSPTYDADSDLGLQQSDAHLASDNLIDFEMPSAAVTTTATAAVGSRDLNDDDVTAVMYATPHRK